MQAIANLIVAAIDLLELEGRAMHRATLRLVWKLLALVGAGVVGLLGLCLLARAFYLLLVLWIGSIGAAALIAVVLLGAAFGLYKYAMTLPVRKQSVRGVDGKSPEERAKEDAVARAQADMPPGRAEGYHPSGVTGTAPAGPVGQGQVNQGAADVAPVTR